MGPVSAEVPFWRISLQFIALEMVIPAEEEEEEQ